eukprot:5864109-Pleurochrysis_carterae.AAC.1
MAAGAGYYMYIANAALGCGPNMVLTVLVLVLQQLSAVRFFALLPVSMCDLRDFQDAPLRHCD